MYPWFVTAFFLLQNECKWIQWIHLFILHALNGSVYLQCRPRGEYISMAMKEKSLFSEKTKLSVIS